MKTKPFDCVAMKRAAAEKIYEQINTMTREEELRFWNADSGVHQKPDDEVHESTGQESVTSSQMPSDTTR
ncbi:hypothetical protein GF339_19605 [candidate division KSB3 bacterium]|uniref:Uncharacterized protein n=1 Tax=candidate division KSB3 bacterium TaxID=2044937 RepID=A0A9D5JZ25_9BACT|nr:hypothetical protein [candidate division KSB3 bacterium]